MKKPLLLLSLLIGSLVTIAQTPIDDFESGNLNGWTVVNGSITADQSLVYSGQYSAKVDGPSTGRALALKNNFSEAGGIYEFRLRMSNDSPGPDGDFFFQYVDDDNYLYLTTRPQGTPDPKLQLSIKQNGTLSLLGVVDNPSPIEFDVWYLIKVERSIINGTITVWLDNVLQFQVQESSFTTAGTVGIGGFKDFTYFDDMTFVPEQSCSVSISANPSTTICSGQTVTLTANSSGNSQSTCQSTDLSASLQNGLVAFYPFCGDASDESGNGNDGTVNGATLTTDRFGNANSAYSFNGVDQRIDVNDAPELSFANEEFSYSVWLKIVPDVDGNSIAFCKYGITSNFEYLLNTRTSDTTLAPQNFNLGGTCNPTPTGLGQSGSNVLALYNDWHHVAYTSDGTSASFYVDGQLVATNSNNPSSCNMGNGSGKLYIGMGGGYNQQHYFSGEIDDLALYNRGLSQSEVDELYALSGSQYLWSTQETTQSITVSPSQTTTYSVTVTQGNTTCTDDITVTVTNPIATITVSGSTTFCQGGSVTLTASSGDSYLWSNGQTTQSITVTQTGSYSVDVTQGGCTGSSQSVSVTVLSNPTVTLQPFNDICVNASPFQLSGGSPSNGTYMVNGNSATQFDPNQTGVGNQTITYSYTDQNNCSGTASETINVMASPSVSLSGLNTNYSLSDNPSVLIGTPSGGVFSGNGVSNGEFDPSDAGLGTHSVLYMYVDGNGCMGGDALCTTVDINVNVGEGSQIGNDGGGVSIYPNPSNGQYSLTIDTEGMVSYSVFDSRGREILNEMFISTRSSTQLLDLSEYSNGVYAIQVVASNGTYSGKLVKE